MSKDWVKEWKATPKQGKPVSENMQKKMNGSAPRAKTDSKHTVRT